MPPFFFFSLKVKVKGFSLGGHPEHGTRSLVALPPMARASAADSILPPSHPSLSLSLCLLRPRVASSGSDELFIPNSILGREASGFEFSPQAAGPQQAPPNPSVMERFQGVISQLFQQRIIRMGGAVDDDMANLIVAQLLYLDAADPKTDVTLYINSPGGSVTAGMAIFDTMR